MQTVQDLKTKIATIKKTQTKGILDIQNLGKWTVTIKASITNRKKEIEEIISGIEDTIESIDSLVKENIKSNKFLTQNIHEIWDVTERSSLRIIWIEGEELQLKGTENIFNKNHRKKLSQLKEEYPYEGTRSLQNTK